MSPAIALESPIFRTYAATAALLLVVAGIVIQLLKRGWHHNVDPVWHAYRGWLVMIPLIFGAIFLGREVTIVFFTSIAVFAAKDFARATGLYRDWGMVGVVYCSIIACGIMSLVHDPFTGRPGWFGMFMTLPVYAISLILAMPIIRNQSRGQLQVLALAILAFVYIGWMFGHVALLANGDNAYGHLLYVLFAVELSDVAVFTFGSFLGKHPLRSNISPKKTWEGAGGLWPCR